MYQQLCQQLDAETVEKSIELTLVKQLTISKVKKVKVKIVPPWIWHPSVGIDNSKRYKKSKEWFEESGFLWEVHINDKMFMVAKESIVLLLMTEGIAAK